MGKISHMISLNIIKKIRMVFFKTSWHLILYNFSRDSKDKF